MSGGTTAISLAAAVASAAMTAYGQYQSGQQQKKMGAYQQAVAQNNALTAERNAQIQDNAADDALARGRIEEQQHRLKVAQMTGTQRSALAASGVQVDTGSALDMVADTAMMGEMDALTLRNNAEREAYQFRVGAYNARAQGGSALAEGEMSALAGRNAAKSGMWQAGGTLLGAASQIGMSYFPSSASKTPGFSDKMLNWGMPDVPQPTGTVSIKRLS